MNILLSQKWCLCLNVQNRIELSRTKNHKYGVETTVYRIYNAQCIVYITHNVSL